MICVEMVLYVLNKLERLSEVSASVSWSYVKGGMVLAPPRNFLELHHR
jgi:hypothetical protein